MQENKNNYGFLTLTNNSSVSPKIYVNFLQISSMKVVSGITVIKMYNGDNIEVFETPEEIFNMITK